MVHIQFGDFFSFAPIEDNSCFMIIIRLVQFTPSNVFCQSVNHAHNSSSVFKVRSDIILSIPIASLVLLPLLNPNRSSPSTSSIFLSILHLNILATVFAVCALRLNVRWPLHSVAFGIFCRAFIVTSVKSLGPSPVTCMLLIRSVITLRPSSPNTTSTSTVRSSSPVAFLTLISMITLLRLCL